MERVVARLSDPLDRAVGWLHDVLEDTQWGVGDLQNAYHRSELNGILEWADILGDVERLTHLPHEPRADYYARIRTSPRAVRVKLADVADNSDPARLALLPTEKKARLEEKYRVARAALGHEEQG